MNFKNKMHFPLFQDILILLVSSVVVVLALQRFKLPSIVGLLITGVIIGPYGFKLINQIHEVEQLSEIGVVLLMFVIGMELSLKQLFAMSRIVFIGGSIQVFVTLLSSFVISIALGFSIPTSIFIGFLFSLSSTAIVLKVLQERNEISAPQGRNALGILIFQDIIVVPMMLITPIMAGVGDSLIYELSVLLGKFAMVLLITWLGARYLVPKFLFWVVKTKNKELFLLFTIALCFSIGTLTALAGLSLALGAFMAGLIISESEYSHQATSAILPFRELFSSFFYVSIGMLMDVNFFFQHFVIVIGVAMAVLIFKSAIAAAAAYVLKYNIRTSIITGLILFQVGEFAFILSKVGISYQLVSDSLNQYFLSVSVLTMLVTPFVIKHAGFLAKKTSKILFPKLAARVKERVLPEKLQKLNEHLIIIGYGMNGKNVSMAARYANIPYVILEINAETVKQEKKLGEPIIYGDAVHEHILENVHIHDARVVVVAISDPQSTKAIVANIRELSSSVYVIVRTRYIKEMDVLLKLGADEVIPEEFETSIEIFSRVLDNYLVPMNEIDALKQAIRSDNYQLFYASRMTTNHIENRVIPNLKLAAILVQTENLGNKTIAELEIRTHYQVSIVGICRGSQLITHISPKEQIRNSDVLYVSGEREAIGNFKEAMS